MKKRDASPFYFEEIGERFDAYMSSYDVARRIALIESLLPRAFGPGRCVEVGCGNGKITEYLRGRVGDVVALDISFRLVQSVTTSVGSLGLAADACRLPIADDSVDLVVSSECIEHTPDPLMAVLEMARIVRPGGRLVLTSPNKLWYPILVAARVSGLRKFQGPERWSFPRTVAGILERASMSIDRMSGCHLVPWQIPGAKRVLPTFDRFGTTLYPAMINFGLAADKRDHVDR